MLVIFLKIIFSIVLVLILFFLFWPLVYKVEYSWQKYLKYSCYISFFMFSGRIVKTENSRETELKIGGLKTDSWKKAGGIFRKNAKKRETQSAESAGFRTADSKTAEELEELSDHKETEQQKLLAVDSIKNIKAKIKRYHRLFSRANIEHLARFVGRLLYLLKPDFLELNFLLGCSDPYYNGLLLAVYHSIKNSRNSFPVNLCVNWEQEVMVGSGEIKGKIMPAQVVRVLLRFIFSCRSYHLFKQLYQWKRKTKKGGD